DKQVRPLLHLQRKHDRHGERPGTFLLALTPPAEVEPAETLPRDVVLLLDRSASMSDDSLDQARRAVRYLVNGLDKADRVALLAFDHEVMELLHDRPGRLVSQREAASCLDAA